MSLLAEFRRVSLTRYVTIEGECTPDQAEFFHAFLQLHPEIRRVAEVGFNGGMSAAVLLSARADVQLLSFDAGYQPYVPAAKQLIDELFPGRHRLILGDSCETLPAYLAAEPSVRQTYDLVFVDGGHGAPVPASDLRYARQLLRPTGWVILDDYCPQHGGDGVIAAWDAAVAANQFVQVLPAYTSGDRGWVCGQPGAAP